MRSISREEASYKCAGNQDCMIESNTRLTQCHYCRFKKCKKVGMEEISKIVTLFNSV